MQLRFAGGHKLLTNAPRKRQVRHPISMEVSNLPASYLEEQ
jgi:hypothetical protein